MIELLEKSSVLYGLRDIAEKTYSMRQNLEARVQTPILEDGTKLFETSLDSKTMNLYGSVNQDFRFRFKIDHDFDSNKIINADINEDGSISIDEETYLQSQGKEFIIIDGKQLRHLISSYAIASNNYEEIRMELKNGRYPEEELKKAGGFKIGATLTPECTSSATMRQICL